jgi:hypothetical protein
VDDQGDVLLEKAFNVAPISGGPFALPRDQGERGGREYSVRSSEIPASFDFLRR